MVISIMVQLGKRRALEIWTAVVLVCGLAGALAAASVSLPAWTGFGAGVLLSCYVAMQANMETPGNRDLRRAQRGEKDESAGDEVHHGRHRSSGDAPPHVGGGIGGS